MVGQLIPQQAINLLLRGLASNHAVHLGVQGKSKEDHHTVWSNFLCSTHLEPSLWLLYETGSEGLHGRRTPKDHLWSQTLQVVSWILASLSKSTSSCHVLIFLGFQRLGGTPQARIKEHLQTYERGAPQTRIFVTFWVWTILVVRKKMATTQQPNRTLEPSSPTIQELRKRNYKLFHLPGSLEVGTRPSGVKEHLGGKQKGKGAL